MRSLGIAASILLCLRCVATEAASAPVLSVDPAVDAWFVEPANNKTWGYLFEVKSPITATHLGWNDTGRNGLSHSHQVGIWKDTVGNGQPTTLLTSATIPAGSVAELSGPWRRVQITPLVLQPGIYSIGGQNKAQSTDDMVYIGDPPLSVVDPRVDIISFDYNINGPDGFHPPGSPPSWWYAFRGVELGPMFFVEAVPEPGTASIFLIGFTLFAERVRRESRRLRLSAIDNSVD